MLNKDQKRALAQIVNWFRGPSMYHILDGSGGVGKTYLVNEVLKQLKAEPLLLAPTNEALKQLRDKVTGDYPFRTIHSALGLSPTVTESELKFEHIAIPTLWEDVNLAVVDEGSMVDHWAIELLISLGVKILYVGHKSQLPPVKKNLSLFDKCISPVFELGYSTSTLRQPMRNTGALWDFNNLLDEAIYSGSRVIPTTFDVNKQDLVNYLESKEGIDDFLGDKTKVILYTNDGVDRFNAIIRKNIFGTRATQKYLPGDKIILTAPLTEVVGLERYSDYGLKRVINKDLVKHYANTKAEVKACQVVNVNLNKFLSLACYKIEVKVDEGTTFFYECVNPEDLLKVGKYYEHIAWGKGSKRDKEKAFKEKHFIVSCFAQIKHYFAATAYRLQGASVPKVIAINSDFCKSMNQTLQAKSRYVACSRAMDELMFYRGIM